jgi:hypothetical protein
VKPIPVPSDVEEVFCHFRTCEFSTIAKDDTPITWPLAALYRPQCGDFQLTTSVGFPSKAHNIRRTPRVSMLYSNPTGSGLDRPPAVLVQGLATVSDHLVTEVGQLADYWRLVVFSRQPGSAVISDNPFTRRWMDWYYMRWVIIVHPLTITWWPGRDFARPAQTLEVKHVV